MSVGLTFRTRHLKFVLPVLAIGGLLAWPRVTSLFSGMSRDKVDFSRDIRPILNQNCLHCHGGVRQKNGVSFMFREEALGVGKSGRRTIVPGKPDSSELIARVTSRDPETRMPYHSPHCRRNRSLCCANGSRRELSGKTIGRLCRPKRSPYPK